MKIRALGKNVIVRSIEQNLKTESGIILHHTDEPQRGKVVNIGSLVDDVALKEGDVVLVNWKGATKIGDDLYRLSIDDVVGVFED